MDQPLYRLLAELAGGGLELGRLDADLRGQARTIAELAFLWEAEATSEPPAVTFSASWGDEAGDDGT